MGVTWGTPHPRSGWGGTTSNLGWGYPGYPLSQVWMGGTPSNLGWGIPPHWLNGVPQSWLGVSIQQNGQNGQNSAEWGTPQPDLGWVYPPCPDLGWGTPIQTWDGVPPVQTWDGFTLPVQTWDGVPPCPNLGWGTSHPDLGWGTPHLDLGWGTPPPSRPEMGYIPPKFE